MKILLLIDGMGIGGAETHVLTLAKALIREGETVDVMCAGGAYTEALTRLGARVIIAPLKGRDFRSVLQSMRALRMCQKRGYTVVHAHTRYTAALANFCLPRIPLVTTVHLDFSITKMKRALSCWGRKTLAVSKDLEDYLIREYGVKKDNILRTKNAIDPEEFPPLAARGKDILHVSRLDKDRSYCAHLLCAIAPAIHRRYPERKIYIIGDGDDRAALEAKAARANREAGDTVIIFSGGTCAVAQALEKGALLIGVSRAVLEGASRALPVILSGNDGYGGILTQAQYEERKKDNFCCRGCMRATEAFLFSDICFLLDHACYCEKIRHTIAAQIQMDFSPRSMALDAKRAYLGALRIGIIGYYGFGNFGDEMMLVSIQKKLREAGFEQIFLLYKDGKLPFLSRAHAFRTAAALKKCDIILFGGGNLLQNETSIFSFFYYAALIYICKKQTIVGIGMGIGEIRGAFSRWICKNLLNHFSSFFMRTEADTDYVIRLNEELKGRVRTTCDPCLFLPQSFGASRRKKILAISKKEPSATMLAFLRRKKEEGYTILPLILFPAQDSEGAMQIASLGAESAIKIQSAEDFYQAARDASLCISERLHGAIFSLLSHTPCLLSADSQKNLAFIKDVEMAAGHCDTHSPIQSYCNIYEAVEKEKEAEGLAFGFSEIISFLRER